MYHTKIWGLLLIVATVPSLRSEISVNLTPSVPDFAPVGTTVTFAATASDTGSGPVWYRFRTRLAGTDFHTVRDYSPLDSIQWTANEFEGIYEIEVAARDTTTGETSQASVLYQFTSRVPGGVPVISQTDSPLVFLYSAPACDQGSRMRVLFQSAGGPAQSTPFKPCRPGLSMNFYVAGLRTNAECVVQQVLDTGSQIIGGPMIMFSTPDVSMPLAPYSVVQPPDAAAPNGILLQSTLFELTVATDLNGNLLWFYPQSVTYVTRPEPGGLMFSIIEPPTPDPTKQVIREFDLAGTTVTETNAARVNEQLAALGKRQILGFHHEVRRLRDGKILALAGTEQILTDVQTPGPVDVLSDMILVLDQNLKVVWTWDAFDHFDPTRLATLGDVCGPIGLGCVYFTQADQANDWLHGNSLQQTSDGNILYSVRNQDWVVKIDYNNGEGSGDVIWRLGQDGDFQINAVGPSPWFSHQHDPQFDAGSSSTLMLFDNGNVRFAADPNAHSRGQVLQIDETSRTANLVLNADIGSYSYALGAAQKLPNGNYHFDSGWLPDATAMSVEVDPSGSTVYGIHVGTQEYRSFRMQDLYTAP